MKSKLTEILKGFRTPICKGINGKLPNVEGIAEYLIANGVVVLPFPIGTTYYRIVTKRGKVGNPYFKMIRKAELNWYNVESVLADLGTTVFLTREEAEQALAKENAIQED